MFRGSAPASRLSFFPLIPCRVSGGVGTLPTGRPTMPRCFICPFRFCPRFARGVAFVLTVASRAVGCPRVLSLTPFLPLRVARFRTLTVLRDGALLGPPCFVRTLFFFLCSCSPPTSSSYSMCACRLPPSPSSLDWGCRRRSFLRGRGREHTNVRRGRRRSRSRPYRCWAPSSSPLRFVPGCWAYGPAASAQLCVARGDVRAGAIDDVRAGFRRRREATSGLCRRWSWTRLGRVRMYATLISAGPLWTYERPDRSQVLGGGREMRRAGPGVVFLPSLSSGMYESMVDCRRVSFIRSLRGGCSQREPGVRRL